MATFGNTNTGTNYDQYFVNEKCASPFVLSESNAEVSKLTLYFHNQVAGYKACNGRACIYTDSSGSPGSLVTNGQGDSIAIAANQALGWVDFTFTTKPVLAAGTYWLGVHFDANADGVETKAIATTWKWKTASDTYSDGTASTWGSDVRSYTDEELCCYATYAIASSVPDRSVLLARGFAFA